MPEEHPLYVHDCDLCAFLGTHGTVDLYFCDGTGADGKTLIARRSSDGPDYSSGLWLVGRNADITEAHRRAIARGLLQPTDEVT